MSSGLLDWFSGKQMRRKFDTSEALFTGLKNQQTDAILHAQLKVLPILKKIMYQFGLPADSSDDILNRSTLIFLQKIESGAYQFQGHAPTTYFVEIIRRVALMSTRNQKRPLQNLENHLELADPEAENWQEKTAAKETVRQLLDQLGEPCSTVVRLHHIEGWADEEVVNQQLTPYSTVNSLKVKRSDCMKKLIQLAKKWKISNPT